MAEFELALYCERRTDQVFLPIVIRRASQQIINQYGEKDLSVLPIKTIEVPKGKRAKCILEAAIKASTQGYQALIIHSDADNRTYTQTRAELFDPGFKLVQQANERVCKNLLPIIPVREMEAWMLADHEMLQEVLNTKMKAQKLGLPAKAREVEADPDPKQTLKQVLQRTYAHKSRRHRQIDIDFLYEPLAQLIRLERLNELPAYQQFVTDLTAILQQLNFISKTD